MKKKTIKTKVVRKRRIKKNIVRTLIIALVLIIANMISYTNYLKAREEIIIEHGIDCGALEMFNVDSYISYLLQ